MAEYEVVREIKNSCPGNQMRDIFIEEVETDDPAAWVRGRYKGACELTVEELPAGSLRIPCHTAGLVEQYQFTRI